MATATNAQSRRALGLWDTNVLSPRLTPVKQSDAHAGDEKVPKNYGELPRKHSLDFSDDGQTPKAARYIGVSDKRVGIEHWLQDGVVDRRSPSCPPTDDTRALCQLLIEQGPHITSSTQKTFLNLEERDYEARDRFGLSGLACDEGLQPFNNPRPLTSFSGSAAAMALRLRLRVALFKVQTNQTAIPISHLQLPETSPQPLSVFPPSLVRVSDHSNTHDKYYDFYDDDETTTAPPSSPPPLTAEAVPYGCGVPFLTPIRSSSPSPKHGKSLDFGSSSVAHGESSPAHN